MTSVNQEENIPKRITDRHIISRRTWTVVALSIFVVLIDQIVKIYVKTHFYLGESYQITDWWEIKFIENNGMAFGLELWNKLVLSLGRIVAVAIFIWFVVKIKTAEGLRIGFYVAVALVIAGAAGNIFDCVFYGEIFNNPMPPEIATMFPTGGGYAGWFEGKVVDMLYFPLFSFHWPNWIPGIGGNSYEFFQYIFNIADASICIGVALLIFFYSNDASRAFMYLSSELKGKETREKK